ncbi:MAG: bifunctional 3-(3-hydroxy-phenyl)propionate/3-hydroxycinnamic acid hydroxylase [Myxococcota bacterium]
MPERRARRSVAAVVIVGCGPVGMTLANLLGVYGVRTIVLERNNGLYDHPRAVGTDSDSLRAWQAVGLAERLLEDMTPMGPGGLGMVYVDARRRPFMEVRPGAHASGFAFGYGLVQPIVDRVLLDGLARFDAVDVRFGHRVVSVEQDGERVVVRGRRIDDRPFTLDADWVVACDGGASGVRRGLGIRMRGRSYTRSWLVLDTVETRAPGAPAGDVEIRCDPERPCVSVPRLHGHRRFEFLQRRGESKAELESPETIRALIGRFTDPDDVRIVRRATHTFSARVAERFREGRILLAGDAAHVTPPFAAQGLACGIRDVFNLAWKLALVVRGGASASFLDSYQTERSAHDRDSVGLAVRLGWLMMPGSRPRAALTQGLLRLLQRIGPVRRFVREGGPRSELHYRRGFLAGGRCGLRGRTLPQPRVEDWKGRCVPLDDVLGRGFALLGFDVDPTACVSLADRAFWERMGTRFVRVLPAHEACEREGDVRDPTGGFEAMRPRPGGRCLLVRPDRVVAVDAPPSEIAAALRRLERRLHRADAE